MLLMVEKGIIGGICYAIHRYAKANNKCVKKYDKDMESLYLKYLDASHLYGWSMSPKLLLNGFKWVLELSQFDEHFIKDYNENSGERCFLEAVAEYPKGLFSLDNDLPF